MLSSNLPVVGVLLAGDKSYPSFAAFCEEMQKLGYRDGQTVRLEARFANGRLDDLPSLAADLLRCGAVVIAAIGAVTYFAARKVAPDLPLVFGIVLDPISAGLIENPQRPGGKTTGSTIYDPGQIAEQIRILKRVVPSLGRLAVLGDAGVPDILPQLAIAAANAERLDAHVVCLRGADDLMLAFANFRAVGAGALLCLEVPRTTTYGAEIVRMAAAAQLPSIFGRDHARYDPFLVYGTSLAAAARLMAYQVDDVLSGIEAGDIPVRYVSHPELIINLNAARKLGISLPTDLIDSAHQVVG
jgi:putative tryptophan/tyrosine transport system substrate-binding protein